MNTPHYFWGKERPSQFDPAYWQSASRMYRLGDLIVIEGEQFDREDDRMYEQSGSFSVSDYRRALRELTEKGVALLVNVENGHRLTLVRDGEDVALRLQGVINPSTTPGGAALSSTGHFPAKLSQLQLDE